MQHSVPSGEGELAGYLTRSQAADRGRRVPGLVLCHGFPNGPREVTAAAQTFPQLADRIAALGFAVLTFTFRGCGSSRGDFSLDGWLDDVLVAADHLAAEDDVGDVWLTGFGTGGALALCAAAQRPDVAGAAVLAAPADFDDWAGNPKRLLEHCRRIGLVRAAAFPPSMDTWSLALRRIRAAECISAVAPRPVLVVHGSEDDLVPLLDARVLVEEHRSAELRVVTGAGHRLRHDPRAIATLLGWLDRQRHTHRA